MYISIILGIIFGSFINALVWRLHLRSDYRNRNNTELSILKGRSICPNCKHKLSSLDLIPIFSWLYLKGKCRYCHQHISTQYPIVELLTGLLFLISYIYWPYNFDLWGYALLIIWLMILVVLISLAIYDLKYKILPNNLVYISVLLSFIFVAINYIHYDQNLAYLLSRVFGVLFSSGIFYLIFQISNGKWIGGGDVKLCIALGLLLGGPLESILMIFLASLIGSLVSFILLVFGKLKDKMLIAFGPLLIFGMLVCFFFGPQILNWYTGLIG
ncbi:MAG TPA: prepilin peptidase [Candidatus Saccharimonadales bacterium]